MHISEAGFGDVGVHAAAADGQPDGELGLADAGLAAAGGAGAVGGNGGDLELRVRRLEQVLAQLEESQREVLAAVEAKMPVEHITAARPSQVGKLFEAGRRFLGGDDLKSPVPQSASAIPVPPTPPRMLLFEAWAELRAIVRMFLDPRYRLTWTSRLIPPFVLILIATSYFWVLGTSLPVIGPWIQKVVDLLLAYVLFKVVSHEAHRYRQTSPDLPSSLRL